MSTTHTPPPTFTTLSPKQGAAIIAATDRDYWAQKHAELVRLDNFLCETYGFSRTGYIKGERVRRTVDKPD